MSTTLTELAELVGGRVAGNGETIVSDALPLLDATPGSLTLVDSTQNLGKFESGPAIAAVVTEEYACSKPLLVVDDLHGAFVAIVMTLRPSKNRAQSGIHERAFVATSASIGTETTIRAGVVVEENVTIGDRCEIHAGVQVMAGTCIGDDCVIFPNTVLYPDTKLGNRVTIHAGSVLGADGFGYSQQSGKHIKSAQLGWVEVHDDVEIGANSTIDRGTYGSTTIGEGSKLDNLVHLGHNVRVGKHNLICAQVGIAGSSSTGDYVVLAGQVGIADHVHLNDRAIAGAQSGLMREVAEGEVVFGTPATPRKEKLKEIVLIGRLPELSREVKSLRKDLDAVQDQFSTRSSSVSIEKARIDKRAA